MIAPGKRADIVLLDDLEHCAVSDVIAGGPARRGGAFRARGTVAPVGLNSVKAEPVTAADFRVPDRRSATVR